MQKSRLLLRERFSPLTYLFLTVALFLTMILCNKMIQSMLRRVGT